MADNFFKVKNGLNLPTLANDPTSVSPANSAAGDMAFYNGKLYRYNGTAWLVTPGSGTGGLIADSDVSSVAGDRISGNKITPDFGSQNVTTTGSVTANSAKVSSFSSAGVVHNDASGNLSTSSIVNADVSATAAIDGTKISPNFGSQAVATTGSVSASSATISGLSTAGVVHNSAAGALSTSLIVNADVSASAAIAGTKVDPNFGNQNILTTGTATLNGSGSKLTVDVNNSASEAVYIRQQNVNSNALYVSGPVRVDSGNLLFATNQGIESTAASSTLNIGTGTNTTTINIGTGSGTTAINIGGAGDTVTVAGTLMTVNTTNLDVADKNITVNKGGTDATAAGAGLTVEGTSGATKATIQYDSTLTSNFKLGASGSEAEVATVSAAQTLTNKTLTTPTIGTITAASNTLTISGTGALTLPTGTTAQQPTGVNGMIRYNSTNNAFEGYAAGAWSAIGGSGSVSRITQNSHGFSVGHVLAFNGTNYVKAQADTSSNAEVVGIVSRVVDANTFEITLNGQVSGLTGLTAGGVYFLDPTTAGAITLTEPSVVGQISIPVGVASSTTTLYVAPKRGVVVGSANARTKIYLANGATTNVQSVSAYEAGELAGWVYLDGTSKYRFYVQAQFALNAAGTDWNLSYQTTGDTPPSLFSLGITVGGTITCTVPSGSYNPATSFIQYALNAPAVGATLPLAIDSSLVQFSSVQAKDVNGISVKNAAGSTTNVFVSDAGRVGIGTTSPSSKLNVVESVATIESSDSNGYPRISAAGANAQLGLFRTVSSAGGGYIGANANASFIVMNSSFAEQARINASGDMLLLNGLTIGSSSAPAGKILIAGAALPAGAGTHFLKWNNTSGAVTYDTSSARYKDNIRDSVYGLDHVMKIRSVQFEYKDTGRSDVGLIAEELNPIIPELVGKDANGDPESVSYDRMVSVLVKAIQELSAKNDALEARLAALEQK